MASGQSSTISWVTNKSSTWVDTNVYKRNSSNVYDKIKMGIGTGSLSTGALYSSASYAVNVYDNCCGWGTNKYASVSIGAATPPPPPPPPASPTSAATVSLAQSKTPTQVGESWTLTRSSTNAASCTMTTMTPDSKLTGPTSTGLNGSEVIANSLVGNYFYIFDCYDSAGVGARAVAIHQVTAAATDVCNNLPGAQSSVPAHCHLNGDGVSCAADSGYVISGSSCVPVQPELSITVNGKDAVRVRRGSSVSVAWSKGRPC